MRRTLREQIAGRCIHFTGMKHEKCEAGVVYREIRGCPCILHFSDGATCEKREMPTEEMIQQELGNWAAENRKMDLVLEAVKPIREKYRGKNWHGTIDCPVCKNGTLSLRHASNNHLHGKCSTPTCVAWME